MPVSAPSYLRLSRHNIFYFRWPLPAVLHPAGKVWHIEISLGTRDPKQALRLAKRLEYHGMSVNQRLLVLNMSYADIQKALKGLFSKLLEMEKEEIDVSGGLSVDRVKELQSMVHGIETVLQQGQEANPSINLEMTDEVAESLYQLMKRFNPSLVIEKGSPDWERFKQDIKLPHLSFCKEVLHYNSGIHNYDLSATDLPALSKPVGRPLKPAIDDFIDERMRGKEWTDRTCKDRTAQYALLREILGDDRDVAKITADDAILVKKTLLALPKGRNKNPKTRDLTIDEAIQVEGVEKLDVRTVNEYLLAYQSFIAWLEQHDLVKKNPFKKLAVRQKKAKQQKRKAFSIDQIKAMLKALPEFEPSKCDKSYPYWASLIGIYSGARLNEIAQLLITDIKQDSGVWYFDFNDEGEGKSLKTVSSKRRVPIHDALLERGFIQHVEKLKEKGQRQLFPDFKFQPNFGYGRKLGRWFNETFLVDLNIKDDGLSFHSLRHSFVTNLRRHVENATVKELVGHSKDDVTEDVYMHDYDLSTLKAAINKLSYQ